MSPRHEFSKTDRPVVRLVAGLGVEGDAHAELHDELATAGFVVGPGDMGENVTTRGWTCSPCPPAPACAWGSRPSSK